MAIGLKPLRFSRCVALVQIRAIKVPNNIDAIPNVQRIGFWNAWARCVPNLIPRSCGLLCFDCRDDRQEQIGPDVEAAAGDTSAADVVLGPNEGSSIGNVTGGRKLARYDFGRRPDAIPHALLRATVSFCTVRRCKQKSTLPQSQPSSQPPPLPRRRVRSEDIFFNLVDSLLKHVPLRPLIVFGSNRRHSGHA
jgi:hypothetical protein